MTGLENANWKITFYPPGMGMNVLYSAEEPIVNGPSIDFVSLPDNKRNIIVNMPVLIEPFQSQAEFRG